MPPILARRSLLAFLAGLALLAACGNDHGAGAGPKAGHPVEQRSQDMAITGEVKSGLARDDTLGELSIAVETAAGHVVLRGSTPDTASRQRASDIARAVGGVRAVDNQLHVQRLP